MRITSLLLSFLALASAAHAGSLEKAVAYRTNGLSTEAKRELVEITFDDAATPTDKAEAYLLLGDIAVDESKPDVAKDNWARVIDEFPDQPVARLASEKIALLDKLSSAAQPTKRDNAAGGTSYSPGTVLVIGPEEYSWSIPQIAGALGAYATAFDGSVLDAIAAAKSEPNIAGLVEIALAVDTAFESGRVVCMSTTGKKLWEEKVMFNMGGGADRIARRFVDNLSKKVAVRKCPAPPKK